MILLAPNGTLGAMRNEFARQKGLRRVPWSGRNELRKTSHEQIIIHYHCYYHEKVMNQQIISTSRVRPGYWTFDYNTVLCLPCPYDKAKRL